MIGAIGDGWFHFIFSLVKWEINALALHVYQITVWLLLLLSYFLKESRLISKPSKSLKQISGQISNNNVYFVLLVWKSPLRNIQIIM